MEMNKKYFMCLLCSLGALNSLSIAPAQAILDKIGLENYKQHGQKLKKLAKDVLAKDGYTLDLDKPIGAGYNGAVFKGTDIGGNDVAIKLSYSDSSQLQMSTSSSWKPHTPSSYFYSYIGELELARRFVDLDTYDAAHYDKALEYKKYQPVYLGTGLPKIRALYRFLSLDKWNGNDWSIVTVMDWVDGEDLETYTNKHGFNESDVLNWSIKILEALKPLHDAGWYHRDLNASNIIRKLDGSLCVVDLGKAIDWYDLNHNTVPPWHNPNLIANHDRDPDRGEMYKLLKQLRDSKQYQVEDIELDKGILEAFNKSENCKELYEKLVSLRK